MLSAVMPSFWVLLGFGCPPPESTGNDTDTPRPVTCDTEVVPAEPCLVAADGSGTYTTIQEAVDAAFEGDVITVCPGYYDESVVIDDVGVRLQGYGAGSTCIIGTTSSAIAMRGVEVELSDFTVSGNAVDPGAISARSSTGSIYDLRIAGVDTGPAAIENAVMMDDSEFSWEFLTVEDNGVSYGVDLSGGNHVLRHGLFSRNRGAGLVSVDGTLVLTNSIFIGNSGSGLAAHMSSGVVANNVFYANLEGLDVYDGGFSHVEVRNNVFLSNSGGIGGTVTDTDYNAAWDNARDWPGPEGGEHDMVVDPMFVDIPAADFRLQPGSPLIDAGDLTATYDDPDGSRNDIGIFGGPYGGWTP